MPVGRGLGTASVTLERGPGRGGRWARGTYARQTHHGGGTRVSPRGRFRRIPATVELHACKSQNPRHDAEAEPHDHCRPEAIWRIPEPPILFLLVGTRGNAGNGRESSLQNADVAQLVEHHLAKVDVASSNLVVRSQDTVTANIPRNERLHGGLAERRGSGLQSRIHGFESRTHLGENHGFRILRMQWAIGAAVARFPDTEEVTGSIPVSPTRQGNLPAVPPEYPGQAAKCGRSSAGRAPPCQGGCREFESRRPLSFIPYRSSGSGRLAQR